MKRVFANGCFDLIHSGHIHTLEQAKSLGEHLTVAVNSDDSVERLKGKGRPIVPLRERIAVLQGLRCVDVVIPFWDDTPEKLVWALRPDIIVKGSDWKGKKVAGEDVAHVEFIETLPGYSTTDLIKKVLSYYEMGLVDSSGRSVR